MTAEMTLAMRQAATLSPRLQQALEMLQLSTLDFELALREMAGSNPFIEMPEEEAADVPDEAADFAFQPPGTGNAVEGIARIPQATDLRDQLREQLYGSRCDERQRLAAELVIDSLDEDGYLREDLPAADIEPPLCASEIEAAKELLRGFEPAGVCAASLVDCLQLQLDAAAEQTPAHVLARRILTVAPELLERREYRGLAHRLDCGEAALHEALALLRRLDPSPARAAAGENAEEGYVMPDVVVREQDGRYVAFPTSSLMPATRINQGYVQMFRQGSRRGEYRALAGQLQEARWLLRNLRRRCDTIMRVAACIVERQQAFFAEGDFGLSPLLARDVARELGCHESTVSRAVGHKYMATPRGCFEFRHFFTRELGPARDSRSAGAVRGLIREMIEAERRDMPLSDVDIAGELRNRGVHIARRTVTKYRRMLKLPPVEFRRSVARAG